MTTIRPHNWNMYDLIPQILDRGRGLPHTACRCGIRVAFTDAYQCPHCRTLFCDLCALRHRIAHGPRPTAAELANYQAPFDADSL